MNALELRENAKFHLEQIKTIETGVDYLNKVKAIETWAKAEKKDAELQNMIAEQKIRTQRILGGLLKESEVSRNSGGDRGNQYTGGKVTSNDHAKLSDFGITKNDSSTFQKIAELPEDIFEKEIAIAKDESKKRIELTTSRVLIAAKEFEKQTKRSEQAEAGKDKEINVDFRLGDFEQVFADIPDGSVDCIITDPPYPYEFIEVWTKLSRFAKRVLKPNGFCVAYSGQMHLPEVMDRMGEHLDYYWTFAVYHDGQTQIVNGVNLMCRWKPVLIYQNGKRKLQNTFQDYFISDQREKSGHDWQQSKSGVSYLIEMFTNEGDLICEPFAGSGTTIKASIEKKRGIIAAEIDEQTYNIAKAGL